MELNVIDTVEGVLSLKSYIQDFEYVAFDTETTGLTKDCRIIGFSVACEENKAFYVILEKWNGELQPMPYVNEAKDLIALLKSKSLVCHNGTFDCSVVENVFKIRLIESLHTDTMILAHLLNENRRVGLKELAKEYFGEDSTQETKEMKESVLKNGGKLTKTAYEMYKADSYLMGKYGAKDALLTYKLFLKLIPELYDQGLDKFFYEEESMPLLRGPTYDLNTTGLKVDQQVLTKLRKELEAECAETKEFVHKETYTHVKDKYPGTNKKNTFNIGSSQQLSWLLFGQLNLEFNSLTDAGKEICKHLGLRLPYVPSAKREFIATCTRLKGEKVSGKKIKDPWAYIACNKKTLAKFTKLKWVEKLLEYQRKQKLLNTYVKGIESRLQYGIIYPSFLQHGTTSGRYSSRDPNFQNLPREDKRIKSCIVARPGRAFVGADYSQLEPRVFASLSKDPRLCAAFDGKTDFYSVIGMEVYGKTDCTPQKDGSKEAFGVKYGNLRNQAKVIALASTYGATANQLAPTTGKSTQETQEDIDNYFESFPEVKKFMLDSHKQAKEKGQVINIFGRPRRMPEAMTFIKFYGDTEHSELPYAARNILNLAVNHRVQSTGASICNRAMIKFYEYLKEANINSKISLQVHDEIIAECDETDVENVAILMREAMENTTQLPGVRLEALPKIAKSLANLK